MIHTYTYIHPFNGPLSGTTQVSRHQKGKTEARDSEWQWHQLGHMQVCTSLQTDNLASTPPHSFYRPDALPATQPTASKHWRHILKIISWQFGMQKAGLPRRLEGWRHVVLRVTVAGLEEHCQADSHRLPLPTGSDHARLLLLQTRPCHHLCCLPWTWATKLTCRLPRCLSVTTTESASTGRKHQRNIHY